MTGVQILLFKVSVKLTHLFLFPDDANGAGFEVNVYKLCAATKPMDFGDELEYIMIPFSVAILSENR